MSATFHLDDEQRRWVRDYLPKGGVLLKADQFVNNIEASIAAFLADATEEPFREAHDALRRLWTLCADEDPQPVLIRKAIKNLPAGAVEYLDRRALVVILRLFPAEPPVRHFQEWARSADEGKLVAMARLLSAEGARIVKGRSRGGGKRSDRRVEPVIMGEARGVGAGAHFGGRPISGSRYRLLAFLAVDWALATGVVPSRGRSDETGFGGLVHSVFQWLGLPEGSATYALRKFWLDMGKANRPT